MVVLICSRAGKLQIFREREMLYLMVAQQLSMWERKGVD
jgi:hypothetical protein